MPCLVSEDSFCDKRTVPRKNHAVTETKYIFAGDESFYDTIEEAQAKINALAGDEPLLESSTEGACESYQEAVAAWESDTPDYSRFVCDTFDDENYNEFYRQHELAEPNIERFTYYSSYNSEMRNWEANKPEKDDYAFDEGDDNNEGEISPSDEAGE